MQNFAAQTRLTPEAIMDLAYKHFVEQGGLVLIERVMHLHGTEGAVQIEVAGARLGGRSGCDAREAFSRIVAQVQDEYDLTPIFMMLHLHAAHENDTGHLLVQADFGAPVQVRIETQEYERQAKAFLDGLPG